MGNEKKERIPGLLMSILKNKCPNCRKGDLFIYSNPYDLKHTMKMPEYCPVCGQKLELQTGFYFGTGFISYGLSIFFTFISLGVWWFTIGFSAYDNRVFWWLTINAILLMVFQPPLQRLSRSVWISIFVRYGSSVKTH